MDEPYNPIVGDGVFRPSNLLDREGYGSLGNGNLEERTSLSDILWLAFCFLLGVLKSEMLHGTG